MECGSCGSINREGARFCLGCGAPFAPRCPSCGNELPPSARFCDSCGTPLHQTIPAAAGAPTRKIVTVLFTDLTGSTALGERMDPESFRAIMTPVYASMRNEVEAHGGVVTKFVGDGVMAAFGVPDIREDDAMRAVGAAVAMQQAIARLSLDLPVGLSLKVGVNTGEVVVGVGDEDIVGDCVNVASRLEGAAAPGEVLVGEETWRLTRGSATYEPVAPLSLKGKAQPVPAYRLVSLERTQEAAAASFVGRSIELTRLRDAFDEAVAARSSRLVTIIGSPGLGKTRLARELVSSLADRAIVVETRCDAAGSATFDPVADALRTAADIAEAATTEEVRLRLLELIPESEEDRHRIAERAGAILGAGTAGSTEETFWAIRRLVEVAASVLPLVVVIDDLHWAEPLLLDLVEHLLEWNRSAPVLLVVTGRPELREMRPRMTEDAISLEGLDGEATGALACSLLGTNDVPHELLRRLPTSTEGNPLFVREFVRMLVDDGVLRRSGDGWVATIDVEAIQVPPTIHSLLAARVDRLTPHERTVLELASVIGKEFYMGAIAELAPAVVQVDLSAHLESLRRKELVEPAGTYWIDEPVYRFHHALIRDAAYRRLLKESRAELHERVASWLERKTGGLLREHDDLIGYHLEQAHECRIQLGSPKTDLRQLGRRAGQLLASAARTALDLDDLPSAAGLAGRALERLEPDDPDRTEALLLRCEALLATGDVSRATEAVAELTRGAASSPRLAAWSTCFSGELATMTDPSRLRETEEQVAAAGAELAALGDQAGAAKAYTVQAVALAGLGRVGDCEAALDRALNAARECGDRRRATATLAFAPVAALWGPSPVSRAGGRCLDIVRLLRITTGSPAVEATSERCQAVLEAFRGRAPAARRMLDRVRAKYEELGLRQGLLETELFAGIVELAAGDPSAAEDHLREAHDGFFAMGNDVGTARAAALLARALLIVGEEDDAAIFVAESEHLGGDDLKNAIAWRSVRAELLARRDEFADAKQLAEEAVSIASRTDALVDHADACTALAEVCRRAGDADGARRAREAAISLYERKGATAYLDTRRAPHVAEPSFPVDEVSPVDNRCVSVARAYVEAGERSDETYLRANTAVDAVGLDRRPTFESELRGRDAVVAGALGIAQVGDYRVRLTPVATRGDRLALIHETFSGKLGVAEVYFLWEIDEEGLVTSTTVFDLDQLHVAHGALDDRFAALSSDPFDNRCVRTWVATCKAIEDDDWDAFRTLCREDVVSETRRAGLRDTTFGLEAFVEALQAARAVGVTRLETTPLAVRGENFALGRVVAGGDRPDLYSVEMLNVLVIDDDGFLASECLFDPSDVRAAFAELDRIATKDDVAGPAETYEDVERFVHAYNARHWEECRRIFMDDIVYIDRRPASHGELLGAEKVVEVSQAFAELATVRLRLDRYLRVSERGVLMELSDTGWNADGVEFEIPSIVLVVRTSDRRVARIERFAEDERDEALARYEALCVAPSIENTATRWAHRGAALMLAGEWEAHAKLLAPDYVFEDRRSGLRTILNKDEAAAQTAELSARAMDRVSFDVIAVRGDRLALIKSVIGYGGYEVDALIVLDVDPEHGLVRDIFFDASDMTGALAELDERAARSEGNRHVRFIHRMRDALVAQDWEAFRSIYAPDCIWDDRRRGLTDHIEGIDARMANAETLSRAIRDVEPEIIATRGDDLALLKVRYLAEGDFHVDILIVQQLDADDRLVIDVGFDEDDMDAAHAALDEMFGQLQDSTDG